ncbi:MAG: alpha/beta hydrolase [Clostridiaceae bacterium]
MIYFIITLIILTILLCIGYYFTKFSLYPTTKDYDKTYDMELKNGYIDDIYYKNLEKQEVYLDSDFDYKLHGIWFPNKDSKKTIIICHGYTYTLNGSIKYMDMFYKRGFNVLLYDHRYHGKSGGKNCTMGYYEKLDLKSWVSWVTNKTGKDSIIGTHGESMGAATVLMHAAIDDRLTFAIADCPFESVYEQFKYRLKIEYKLPPFPFLNFANLITKIKTKAFYKDIAPIKTIENIKFPVLFIHGDSDTYIPYSHTQHMYDLKKGPKQLYFAKGADHAKSYFVDKDEYQKVVYKFLDSIDELKQ